MNVLRFFRNFFIWTIIMYFSISAFNANLDITLWKGNSNEFYGVFCIIILIGCMINEWSREAT